MIISHCLGRWRVLDEDDWDDYERAVVDGERLEHLGDSECDFIWESVELGLFGDQFLWEVAGVHDFRADIIKYERAKSKASNDYPDDKAPPLLVRLPAELNWNHVRARQHGCVAHCIEHVEGLEHLSCYQGAEHEADDEEWGTNCDLDSGADEFAQITHNWHHECLEDDSRWEDHLGFLCAHVEVWADVRSCAPDAVGRPEHHHVDGASDDGR